MEGCDIEAIQGYIRHLKKENQRFLDDINERPFNTKINIDCIKTIGINKHMYEYLVLFCESGDKPYKLKNLRLNYDTNKDLGVYDEYRILGLKLAIEKILEKLTTKV